MTQSVDFFYGLGSRYSYLASTQIARLEADTGCRVRWRPLYSAELFSARGLDPFRGKPVSGQYAWSYRRFDAECWAGYSPMLMRSGCSGYRVSSSTARSIGATTDCRSSATCC